MPSGAGKPLFKAIGEEPDRAGSSIRDLEARLAAAQGQGEALSGTARSLEARLAEESDARLEVERQLRALGFRQRASRAEVEMLQQALDRLRHERDQLCQAREQLSQELSDMRDRNEHHEQRLAEVTWRVVFVWKRILRFLPLRLLNGLIGLRRMI